jgi:S1-C subfamily serine protease
MHQLDMRTILLYLLILLGSTAHAQGGQAQDSNSSFGTAFSVSHEHLLTAYHVVADSKELWVGPVAGKSWTRAEVIKVAPELDLALLRAPVQAKPMTLAKWDSVPVGLEVFVMGYPQPKIQGLSKKITQGIFNGVRSESSSSPSSKLFQFSAEVNKGNSGAPVISSDGLVIGMVQKKIDALGAAKRINDLTINVNYALKSNHLLEFLESTTVSVAPQALSVYTLLRPYQIYAQSESSIYAVLSKKSN